MVRTEESRELEEGGRVHETEAKGEMTLSVGDSGGMVRNCRVSKDGQVPAGFCWWFSCDLDESTFSLVVGKLGCSGLEEE